MEWAIAFALAPGGAVIEQKRPIFSRSSCTFLIDPGPVAY